MYSKDSAVYLALFGILFTTVAYGERLSTTSKGRDARGDSRTPVVSADGRYVAFSTTARLVADDTNGITDVYVRDRRTDETRLVSDSVGGDQPTISANGRFVAFRSFEYYDGLPRIRVVDLERGGPSFSGAVQNLNSYYQPADMPVLNPNGRFLAFAFRPAPNRTEGSFRDHEITVVDLVTRIGYAVLGPNTGENGIPDLGRFAMSADAKTFVFETTAALTNDDTNNTSDIYLVRRPLVGTPLPEQDSPPLYIRLSRAASGGSDNAGSYDPVISLDGKTAFFISDAALAGSDADERATIYAIDVPGNPGNLRAISTAAVPITLAREATISGRYIGYLGQRPSDKAPRPYMVNVTDGSEHPLANGANGECEAPVLSGDDHFVVYASKATNLAGNDRNRSFDVFAEVPRNAPPARKAPQVVLSQPSDGDRPQRGLEFAVSSQASDPNGTIQMHTFEFDSTPGKIDTAPVLNSSFTPPVAGLFPAQSRAFNDAWIEGRSEVASLVVREPNVTFAIAGVEQLKRTDKYDGSTEFDLTVSVENRGNSASPPLTLLITAASTPFTTNFTVNLDNLPKREEQVIAVVNTPVLTALERRSIRIRGVTPPTEALGNAEQGLGWTVTGKLRAGSTLYSTMNFFQTVPRLTENTFLPNGGIPTGGNPNAENQFNPALLQELQIIGRAEVAAGSRANYTARAVFNTGTRACVPTWSVQGSEAVSISPDGMLNARNVQTAVTVTVKAAFGGQTASRKVKIAPVSPRISVRADDPEASESGDGGAFRLFRSPATGRDITVNYKISGSAAPGVDYTALTSSVTIPAGSSSVTLPVAPLQDGVAEGNQTVELTLLPDPAYRLGAVTAATISISDDEAFPAGQPDGVLQYGDEIIGAHVVDPEYGPVSGIETSQEVEVWGRKGRTERFTLTIANRDAVPRTFTVTSAASALGFVARYFSGDQDITDAVIAGTYNLPLAAGETQDVSIEITPTKDAAIGTYMYCEILVKNGYLADKLAIEVERVR